LEGFPTILENRLFRGGNGVHGGQRPLFGRVAHGLFEGPDKMGHALEQAFGRGGTHVLSRFQQGACAVDAQVVEIAEHRCAGA
jgi:hypothetical protein